MWLELAKLYRSVNDFDSIRGLFTAAAAVSSSTVSEHTRLAFEHEASGDYYLARKCYTEALSSAAASDDERDLWEQSLMRCCSELTDWRAMADYFASADNSGNGNKPSKSLGALHERDADTFPYAFRCKLKLILHEDVETQLKHADLVQFLRVFSHLYPRNK